VNQFKTRQVISFHASWDYFAARYGLTLAGVIEKTPGRNPTPREIAGIVPASANLTSGPFSPNPVQPQSCGRHRQGSRRKSADPGSAGRRNPSRTKYLYRLMTYNLQIMKEAMQ